MNQDSEAKDPEQWGYHSTTDVDGAIFCEYNGELVRMTARDVRGLIHGYRFYRGRIKAIDSRMRDWPEPAREEAISIVANGTSSLMPEEPTS